MAARILFALPGLHGGGAERVVVTVLRHLDRARFEPHLLVAAAVGPYLGEVPADVPVHAVGATRLRRALPGLVRAVWRLRPAAIASTQGYMNFALLLARPLLPRTRLVVREVIGERYLENSRHRDLLYRWYLRRVRLADRIVTQSDGAAREIAARVDARPGQVARIYTPVDVTRVLNEARAGERPYAGAGPHVVAAGRVGPQKGFDLLLEAFARARVEGATLTVLGEGPDRAALVRRADDLGIGRAVRFVGFQSNPYRYFAAADAVACAACPALYPRDGVIRFVARAAYAESFGLQWKAFPQVQLDGEQLADSERRLRRETGLEPADLRGRLVLEAGCGMGRFLDVVSRDGAALAVGVDLSAAVDAAAENLGARPNVLILQGDIFRLPLAPGSFDVVYSIGVLHHTPSAEQAFRTLVPLVKPGGTIAISVYAATVKPGVGWALNMFRRRFLRAFTRRLPKRAILWWARYAVPVFWVIDKVPVVRYVRYFFPVLLYRDYPLSWSVLDTFDTYATELESRHRPKEVFRWFREAGLVDIDLLDSDDGCVSVRGRVTGG